MDGAAVTTTEGWWSARPAQPPSPKQQSKSHEDRVKERPAFIAFPTGLFIQDAVPILHEGECEGAMTAS